MHTLPALPVVIASAAARLVSLRHNLVHHTAEDGTTAPAVFVLPLVGAAWWHLDAWLDGPEEPEGCLTIRALGCHIEVFYRRPQAVTA